MLLARQHILAVVERPDESTGATGGAAHPSDIPWRDALELASASGSRLTVAEIQIQSTGSQPASIQPLDPAGRLLEIRQRAAARGVSFAAVSAAGESCREIAAALTSLRPNLWVVSTNILRAATPAGTVAEAIGWWRCDPIPQPVWISGRQPVAAGFPIVMAVACRSSLADDVLGWSVDAARALSGRLLILALPELPISNSPASVHDEIEHELRQRLRLLDHRTIPGGVRIEVASDDWSTAVQNAVERQEPALIVVNPPVLQTALADGWIDANGPQSLRDRAYLVVAAGSADTRISLPSDGVAERIGDA